MRVCALVSSIGVVDGNLLGVLVSVSESKLLALVEGVMLCDGFVEEGLLDDSNDSISVGM